MRLRPQGEVPQRNHVCCLVSPPLARRRTILSPFSFQGTRCRPAAGSRMLTASPKRVKKIVKPFALFHPPAKPNAAPGGSRDRKELPARLRSGDRKFSPWSRFCQQEKEHRRHRFRTCRPAGRLARSEGGWCRVRSGAPVRVPTPKYLGMNDFEHHGDANTLSGTLPPQTALNQLSLAEEARPRPHGLQSLESGILENSGQGKTTALPSIRHPPFRTLASAST